MSQTEIDNETFRKGIRDNGMVEGYFVETYYLPCIGISDDDGFMRVQIDDNATDIETRIPHSTLNAAGWFKAASSSLLLDREEAEPQTADSVHLAVPTNGPESLAEATPIDMLLFCPDCGEQHIDAPEEHDSVSVDGHGWEPWTNPPHKSHLCHGCGCIWRPANVPTNGVACGIPRGKADTWLVGDGAIPTAPASLEALIRSCYDDASQFPEMCHPLSGDWLYDDNHDCAEAIRKRGDETARHYVERATSDRFSAPLQDDPKCNKGTPAILVSGSGDRGREPKGSGISGEGGEE